VELPWVAAQVSLFSTICYFLIHFQIDAGKFFFFWLALFLSCLNMAYLGMVMVCVTPNLQMGITAGATILVWCPHLHCNSTSARQPAVVGSMHPAFIPVSIHGNVKYNSIAESAGHTRAPMAHLSPHPQRCLLPKSH
jgi:hypothetical protein